MDLTGSVRSGVSGLDLLIRPSSSSTPDRLTQRRSFGSAGYLGLHDQRTVELSLRRALVFGGSPPTSPSKTLVGIGSGIGGVGGGNGGILLGADEETRRPRTAR